MAAADIRPTGEAVSNKALVAGGSTLAIAMFAANGGNYLLNVFLGRWLTPPEFADANLMVTLMLLVTAVAVALQLIAARFAGINAVEGAAERTLALALDLRRWARLSGIGVGVVLAAGSTMWADFFNVESAWPFVILGFGMPAYLTQAVGRGVLQGQLKLRSLARTFVHEMIVRVVLGIGLVAAGFGVIGATAALSASFFATWVSVRIALGSADEAPSGARRGARRTNQPARLSKLETSAVVAYAGPVGLLLLAQIIINNGDVLISKHGLAPEEAGVYAAIALVGRAVFFLSWSVATTLFPAAAQRGHAGENPTGLLHGGLAAVAMLGTAAVLGARLLGGTVLGRVFGAAYSDVSSPLALYALATAVFALANLIVSHYLALGYKREAIVLLLGGGLQTALLLQAERTIDGLIGAQVVAMTLLAAAIAVSHVARIVRPSELTTSFSRGVLS